ncbi:MAG TPA: ATP-binding protein [Tepidisphaeraceae bacterium]|nr:ATP-binding protein [Tepidisphaeraceae bacterium]
MNKTFSAIRLRSKLWLGLGGMFLILLVGSAISAIVLTHFSHELQRLLRENYDSEVYCEEMSDALDRLDASSRQLAWEEAGHSEDFAAQEKRFDDNLAKQFKNVTLPGELEETRLLAAQWRTYRRAFDNLRTAPTDQRKTLYVQSLSPNYAAARITARRIMAANMKNVVAADGRVGKTTRGVRQILLILVGAGALLAVVVFIAAGTTVLNPIRDLTRSVGRIGAGDLDLAVPVRSSDEVGQLAAAFNAMAERLREYRKSDHERLVRAQTTTQLAIDSLPDAVLVTSPEGIVEIANRTACEQFSAEPGRNIADLGLDWLVTLHREALAGKQVKALGYASAVQLFQEGEEKFLLPRDVPMLHEGRVVGVAIILVDVTRLRQADEFKSGLVATVSHELRTPLTAMRMSTTLLADETLGPLNAGQKKLAAAAKEESERLFRIIENLLNFSRAQAGAARVKPHGVSVRSLIADALAPLAPGFEEKQIRVSVNADSAPDAWADPPLAASVLGNLLSNALKFTPIGGRVDIDAHCRDELVEISVADNGPGVAPEHAAKLFHRFFRVAGPDSPPGTGLGLAISREIATAHGGTLSYAPRPGGGSIFRFALPTAVASKPVIMTS